MKGKSIIFTAAFLLFLYSNIYSDDINSGLNNVRTAYRNGKYNSVLKGSVAIVDSASMELLKKMTVLLPDISNFTIIETNSSYSFSVNNGIADFNLTYEKILSNSNEIISLSLDTSLYNIERYLNLIKSYEYLDDKADFERYYFLNKKITNFYIIDKTSAYLAYPVDVNKETEEVLSGLLFKMSFNKSIKNNEKRRLIENYIKSAFLKFKSSSLDYYLK